MVVMPVHAVHVITRVPALQLRQRCRQHQVCQPLMPPRSIRALATEIGALGPNPEMSWQIAAGAVAGLTPFVVAGIEFSKRIIEQRNCKVCQGSGLVKRDKYYFRCYGCGGFLPWQSWRRFFTGK